VLAKAICIRLIAVLISGTLATAPFSCCCAAMQSQEIEALVHPMPAPSMPAMYGMDHGKDMGQIPLDDHPCPHKVTASLDAGKTTVLPSVAAFAKPVVYDGTVALEDVPEWPSVRPVPHIRPPPNRPATLVSQHVLLLI
jgi:hypothetical protein